MEPVEVVVTLLTTIVVSLSSWVLKKVSNMDKALATQKADLTKDMTDRLEAQIVVLSDVRDMVLGLRQAVSGTTHSDGLLDQFARFADRYDERSKRNESWTQELDKRLALVELHLQYILPQRHLNVPKPHQSDS